MSMAPAPQSPLPGWTVAEANAVQPAQEIRRNKVWRPLVALVAMAAVLVGVLAIIADSVGGVGLVIGAVLAVLPVAIVVRCYLWLDRWEPEPPAHLWIAFGWGASAAAAISLVINTAATVIADGLVGPAAAQNFGAIVVAPIVEEASKAMILVWFLVRHRDEIDGVLDGLVLAGLVGSGFAFTENILYFGNAFMAGSLDAGLVGGVQATTATFVMRGLIAPFAHPLFTSMTGIGIGVAARSSNRVRGFAVVSVGYVAAVAMHAIWNASASVEGDAFFVVYLLFMVPVFVAGVGLAVWSRRREGRLVAKHLPAYVQAGWLAPDEIALLSNQPTRKALIRAAGITGGQDLAAETARYHALVTELCFLRERRSHDKAGPESATRQVELLVALAEAREHAMVFLPGHRPSYGARPTPGQIIDQSASGTPKADRANQPPRQG